METNERRLTHRHNCQSRSAVGCTCGVLDRWREDAEQRAEDRAQRIDWEDGR